MQFMRGQFLAVVTGRRKGGHGKYGCPQNFYRGACSNRLKEHADVVENRLLIGLQRSVLRPEVVEYAIGEFERQLKGTLTNLSTSLDQMRERREAIQREIDRLVTAIATVEAIPRPLRTTLSDREKEARRDHRQDFCSATRGFSLGAHFECSAIRHGSVREHPPIALFRRSAGQGRDHAKLTSEAWRMVPKSEGKEGHYVAIGEWNLLGGFEESEPVNAERVRMVAGEGFEPSTFGL